MKILKYNYNWNDGTVDIIFRDGTKMSLFCKGVESELECGIEANGKLQALKIEKPLEYAQMALNGTMQDYCNSINRSLAKSQNILFRQFKECYPDMSDEQIMSLACECQMYGE